MVYYRLYLLAEPGGRFVGFEEIEAADDDAAIAAAEAYPGAQALELWCGKRKVQSFASRSDRRSRAGSRIRASRPPSGRFSSSSLPPCACAAARARVRPRPEPPVSRLREASSRTNGSWTMPSSASGMPGPLSATSIADPCALGAHRRPGRAAIFDRIVDQVAHRAAQQIGLDRRRPGAAPSSNVDVVAQRAELLDHRVGERGDVDRARSLSAARPERASASVSSSIAVISSIVAIILSRSASGSMLSARMRSEARGVRRSWPIAPSIRSFSSSMRRDARAHRVEGEDRAADVGRAARLDLRRLAAALESARRPR